MIFQKSNQRMLPNILVWSDLKVTFLVVLKVLKHYETNAHWQFHSCISFVPFCFESIKSSSDLWTPSQVLALPKNTAMLKPLKISKMLLHLASVCLQENSAGYILNFCND